MTFVVLSLVLGMLMILFTGLPWLPTVEGFAIFAPVHYLMHNRDRFFSVLYYFQIMAMSVFAGYTFYDKGVSTDWQKLAIIFLASFVLGYIGRWVLNRNQHIQHI